MPTTDPSPADQHARGPDPAATGGHQMDSRMTWVK